MNNDEALPALVRELQCGDMMHASVAIYKQKNTNIKICDAMC